MSTQHQKNLRRRVVLTGALAASAAVMASSSRAEAAGVEDTLATVEKRGSVIIGILSDGFPWGFLDNRGQFQGIDADVGRLFGKYLGVRVHFVAVTDDNRIAMLQTGRVDILFAWLGMLPARAKSVQYSEPYSAEQTFVVAPKSTKISGPADMASMTVGVPKASTQEAQLRQILPPSTHLRTFDGDAATIQALLSGQVQAVGANEVYQMTLDRARPGTYETKFHLWTGYDGAGVRQGDCAWVAKVNKFITKIRSDGTLAAIYEKWLHLPLPSFPASMPGVPFSCG